jgi:hypothetical protein
MKSVRMIGFSGHTGLPPETMNLVERALRIKLEPHAGPGLVGVTMLGPDADQLFARVVLDLGGALYVVQPTKGMQYRDGFESEAAKREYDRLYPMATYFEALEFTASSEEAHMAGGRTIVERSDRLLAAWDREPARGHGGTADVVAYAQERGVPVEVIWPEGATRE